MSEKPLVLLMDDHRLFCKMMNRALIRRGFDVVVFTEKDTAFEDTVEYLSEEDSRRPDSLLLDIVINGFGGMDVAEKALEEMGFSSDQIFLLTGCHETSKELTSSQYRKLSDLGVETLWKDEIDLEEIVETLRTVGTEQVEEVQGSGH